MLAPNASPEVDPDLVIAVDDVTVTRGGNHLVQDVGWQVELDERWVLLGPNGAGKTTLLNLASARLFPTSGTVHVLGERLGRTNVAELRTRLGLVTAAAGARIPGDETAHDTVLTAAWGVVGRFREAYDEMDAGRATELLEQWGVGHLADRRYGTLSDGERKRVQIARAMMTDPELLLLDEPAAGLDLGGREDLVRRLSELALDPDAPATVLVTHHVEEIPPGYTHALLMRDGAVVAAGPAPEVITGEHLSKTFGLPLSVTRIGDRYTAQAL
ncbi:iron ABC transporter ATP-binding protein [Actinocatenispora rupis]|uniref:Iron ABC transporter ATP-binding protein n=1 Tax=Actinocatenispora rupis TaxID=519421 RepID=A0A8J3NF26_9ACTN|nr:iron ABC transporter ATP-binding protein [Actinocatenispora rupis]